MISAGEASGDMHAANALQQLRSLSPVPIEAFGMGGKRLEASGMELVVDSDNHSVMGLIEVLHKYPALRASLARLRRCLSNRKPDILLLVDYPHFNMKLAATAKSLGIPVLYYIAPKVWASRPGRISELKKLVDHMAVILPFEAPLFNTAGIATTYVGNPLLDNTALMTARSAKQDNSVAKRIALLPGSRKNEINNLLPAILLAARQLKEKYQNPEFIVPVAETIDRKYIEEITADHALNITLVAATDYQILAQCDVALVASGTATLELAILGIPMVVVYRINPLSYAIVKRWLTIENVSLVNIIAGKKAVPELLQDNATAAKMFAELDNLLEDSSEHMAQKRELKSIRNKLGGSGAAQQLSELVISLATARQEITKEQGTAACQ